MTGHLKQAGFVGIEIRDKKNSDEIIKSWNVAEGVEQAVFTAYIKALKPSD